MTPEQIKAIREAISSATPGPWRHNPAQTHHGAPVWRVEYTARGMNRGASFVIANMEGTEGNDSANAAFIALARQALPACIEEIDRLTAERDEYKRRALSPPVASLLVNQRDSATQERDALVHQISHVIDASTDLIMHARYIADQVRLGKRALSAKDRSALAAGFDACDRQRAEFARANQEQLAEACPCRHITSCHERCTCANPLSSSGCNRCCTYGSKEQQIAAAKRLTALPARAEQLEQEQSRRERHPLAPERCPVCEWTNTHLMNFGAPGRSRWMCHGCAARTITERNTLSARGEAMAAVYGVAASLRTFPVPFDDHFKLVGAVDACRAAIDALRANEEAGR